MPFPILVRAVGFLPVRRLLVPWMISKLGGRLKRFLDDPQGSLQRLGDVFVWQSPSGQKVLAGLEHLQEGQDRILTAINRLEDVQFAMAGSLTTLISLSLFSVGLTVLTSGLMLTRINALDRRLTELARTLKHVQALLQAQNQALIESSLRLLQKFERKNDRGALTVALAQSSEASATYRLLLRELLANRASLGELSHCGRCHLIALLTEARCCLLDDDLDHAEAILAERKAERTAWAKYMFDEVMGSSPELYLAPHFRQDGVTLELLADVYRQARLAGACEGDPGIESTEMFESMRERVFSARGHVDILANPGVRRELLTKLKLLIACLEDVNRVEAFRLRVADARQGNGYSIPDLERSLRAMVWEEYDRRTDNNEPFGVFTLS